MAPEKHLQTQLKSPLKPSLESLTDSNPYKIELYSNIYSNQGKLINL